ncbi:MAG: hypothetical protein QW086_05160 [Pyrobaculum sp.]
MAFRKDVLPRLNNVGVEATSASALCGGVSEESPRSRGKAGHRHDFLKELNSYCERFKKPACVPRNYTASRVRIW